MLPSRVRRESIELSLAPAEVHRRIVSGMTEVRSLLFTPTWGLAGDFVGKAKGNRFQMRVRHAYSNGYTRLLFGRIEEHGSGSRVVLEFTDVRFVVVLMNVVSVGLAVSALAFAVSALRHSSFLEVVAHAAGPLAVLAIFLVVEVIGRRLGKRDEARMRAHIHALVRD